MYIWSLQVLQGEHAGVELKQLFFLCALGGGYWSQNGIQINAPSASYRGPALHCGSLWKQQLPMAKLMFMYVIITDGDQCLQPSQFFDSQSKGKVQRHHGVSIWLSAQICINTRCGRLGSNMYLLQDLALLLFQT